jgi:hypothetical protein
MRGGAYGKKFGQAFDDSKQDREKIMAHSAFSNKAVSVSQKSVTGKLGSVIRGSLLVAEEKRGFWEIYVYSVVTGTPPTPLPPDLLESRL